MTDGSSAYIYTFWFVKAPAELIKNPIRCLCSRLSSLFVPLGFRFLLQPVWGIKVNSFFFSLLSSPNNPLNVNHAGPHSIEHVDTVIICPHFSCVCVWVPRRSFSFVITNEMRVYFHNTASRGQSSVDLCWRRSPLISTDKVCSYDHRLFFLSFIINQRAANKHVSNTNQGLFFFKWHN